MGNLLHSNEVKWLNKVPEVTLVFWLVKMMSTTVGETAADYLNVNLNLGLTGTSIITGLLLACVLFFQMTQKSYKPLWYWLTVLLVSVFGTLITDNLTDHFNVSLALSTSIFTVALVCVFAWWYSQEKTLSIDQIDTPKREAFYWLAILTTFALGTAAGDWFSEGLQLGYGLSAVVFGAIIAVVALMHYGFKVNAVLCFWLAYILTRPLGASLGDLLSQSPSNGGIGLGVTDTSILFLACISVFVGFMMFKAKDRSRITHQV